MFYFFNPDTLKIVGSSTDPESMSFPSCESEDIYNSFENIRALRSEKDQVLYESLAAQLTDLTQRKEEFGLARLDEYIMACNDVKESMKEPNSRAELIVVAA